MMNRPRKQTYTMDMYLKKIKDYDIRNDSDTQRQFVWSNEQVNELIVTVLTDDYIPPIVLAEVDNSQLWIVDGGQRSSSFNKFRYGNYKITSAVENSVIPYKKKVRNSENNIVWEDATYDIKNKTYDKLPEELKKKFNEYQIETAIHEECDARRIAQLIKRYNNHTSMNSNQKAFTYVDNYAREIRGILDSRFFLDCGTYTEKERNKGVLERVVLESIMCMFHFDQWKKQPKKIASFLNNNSTIEEFDIFNSLVERLKYVISEDLRDLFSSKDSFIWFTLFNEFTKLGLEDNKFADFLRQFKNVLKTKIVNGMSFIELDENRGTKDKAVISSKINLLMHLMCEYFDINWIFLRDDNILNFIQKNIDMTISENDIELYKEIFTGLITKHELIYIARKNNLSVMAVIAFACANDIDLDNYMENLLKETKLTENQQGNYINMKRKLEECINVCA